MKRVEGIREIIIAHNQQEHKAEAEKERHLYKFFFSHAPGGVASKLPFDQEQNDRVAAVQFCRERIAEIGILPNDVGYMKLFNYVITNVTNVKYFPPSADIFDEFITIYVTVVDGYMNVGGKIFPRLPEEHLSPLVNIPALDMAIENVISCNIGPSPVPTLDEAFDKKTDKVKADMSLYLYENHMQDYYVCDDYIVIGKHKIDIYRARAIRNLWYAYRSRSFLTVSDNEVFQYLSSRDLTSLALVCKGVSDNVRPFQYFAYNSRQAYRIFLAWIRSLFFECQNNYRKGCRCDDECDDPDISYATMNVRMIFAVDTKSYKVYMLCNGNGNFFGFPRRSLTCRLHGIPLCSICVAGEVHFARPGRKAFSVNAWDVLQMRYNMQLRSPVLACSVYNIQCRFEQVLTLFAPSVMDADDSTVAFFLLWFIDHHVPMLIGKADYEVLRDHCSHWLYYYKVGKSLLAYYRHRRHPSRSFVENLNMFKRYLRRTNIEPHWFYTDCKSIMDDETGTRWFNYTTNRLVIEDDRALGFDLKNGPAHLSCANMSKLFHQSMAVPYQQWISYVYDRVRDVR